MSKKVKDNDKDKNEKSKTKKENSRSFVKAKTFRMSAKNFILTYSKAHHLERQSVLDQIKCLVVISDYIISEEKHADGSRHIHVQITCERKISVYNENHFDLIDAYGYYIHGNYKTVKHGSKENVIRYIAKDGNYITSHDLNSDLSPANLKERLLKDSLLYGSDYALKEMIKRDPNQINHLINLKRNLEKYILLMNPPSTMKKEDPYPMESFKSIPSALKWKKEEKKKTALVLHGLSGTGKTEYAKSLYPKALFISNKEGLQDLDLNAHEAICYDDFDWPNHNREEILSLIDCSVEKDIDVKYGNVKLHPNIPKMITLNRLSDLKLHQYPEIKRRLTCIEFKGNIYIQVNNNVTNNIEININRKEL